MTELEAKQFQELEETVQKLNCEVETLKMYIKHLQDNKADKSEVIAMLGQSVGKMFGGFNVQSD
jgi:archaellum component FlaC